MDTLFKANRSKSGFTKSDAWNIFQLILGAPKFKRELYTTFLNPPGKLLDFGCATGHISDSFKNFDYYGVDLDEKSIEAAKSKFKSKKNMTFIAADLHTKPFTKNFFDEILFAGTVHHLTDKLFISLLAELHYCLKPGGIIHVIDPVFQASDGWQQKFMRWLDRGKYPRTTTEIMSLVDSVGLFKVGKMSYHTPYGALVKDCDFLHLPLVKQ